MDHNTKGKEKEYRDFYQKIRKKINGWASDGKLFKKRGKWTDKFLQYLLVFPDMVYLTIKLFVDRKVPANVKGYILMLFVYLISPIDILPDFIPVLGFIDDLVVLVIVLNKIINSADKELLSRIKIHWTGEDDIFAKVKEIIAVMNDISSQIPKALYNFMNRDKE